MPMIRLRMFLAAAGALSVLPLGACAETRSAQAPPCAVHAAVAGTTLPEGALVGSWAEYWSLTGAADTQRYLFLDNGRFGWLAPEHAAPNASLQKSGSYELEPSSGGATIVLHVTAEQFARCAGACPHASAGPRRVTYHTPIIERLEVGDCPPNREAEQLDRSYVCRSFEGRAFWRRPSQPEELREFELQ